MKTFRKIPRHLTNLTDLLTRAKPPLRMLAPSRVLNPVLGVELYLAVGVGPTGQAPGSTALEPEPNAADKRERGLRGRSATANTRSMRALIARQQGLGG